jgi:hypothetical protein
VKCHNASFMCHFTMTDHLLLQYKLRVILAADMLLLSISIKSELTPQKRDYLKSIMQQSGSV